MQKKKRSTIPERVNIANRCPRNASGKLWQFETPRNTHLKAEENLEQAGQSEMPIRGTLALRRNLPSEDVSIRPQHQSLERAKSRDKLPSLHVIQTGGENGRSPSAPPYDQRSTEGEEEQEKDCRTQGVQTPQRAVQDTRTLHRWPQYKLLQK